MCRIRLLLFLLLFAASASAHKMAPSLLEIRELPDDVVEVFWRTPILAQEAPEPIFPSACQTLSPPLSVVDGSASETRLSLRCSSQTLAKGISVLGLKSSRTAALVRWYGLDGEEQQQLLSDDEQFFVLQQQLASSVPILQFAGLGIKHILIGIDHLLFVLGLYLLASSRRQLLVFITAFTLGHSLTLALVSLGILPNWPSLAEWLIALSVFFMALCIPKINTAKLDRGSGFVLLVIAFGLLHGLGFATVLRELRSSDGDLLSSLLAFNFGIELGQLVIIAGLTALLVALRSVLSARNDLLMSLLSRSRLLSIYGMGGVSAYWLIDRGRITFETAVWAF
jgi:hydrogenase/urease accessory protein HupE